MSQRKYDWLVSHSVLFKTSNLRLFWSIIHNLVLGDIGDTAWGPGITISQLWFFSPFLGAYSSWRFVGIKFQGRKKWRMTDQKIWVTGRERVGSKKSHHPLFLHVIRRPAHPHLSPHSMLSSQPCFFNRKLDFHLQGRWGQLFPDWVHMPFLLHVFTQRTVNSDHSSFSRSIPSIYEAIFFTKPWAPFVSPGKVGGT